MTTKTKIGFQEESTCRICLESEGKKISPCKCIGSVEWVHEQCLNTWIEKSFERNAIQYRKKQGNQYEVKCQLCHGGIHFFMEQQIGCHSCEKTKRQMKEYCSKFCCLFLTIFSITVMWVLLILNTVHNFQESQNVWGCVFLIVLDLIILAIWLKLFTHFLSSFFVSTKYNIKGYTNKIQTN